QTGRSPNDKFIVREAATGDDIAWGKVNQPLAAEHYDRLKAATLAHLAAQELFVRDQFAGADPNHRFGIRFVTPNAWCALFVYNMFLRPTPSDLASFAPDWTVLHAPEMHADPALHGTQSGTFIVIHFAQIVDHMVLYPGPAAHDPCSAENTANPPASYPIHYVPNHVPGGMGGHPSHVVFLTCDAYGVLPPLARLSPAQAMYHFLSGYTAKVAGTERGVTEPKATFSTRFGAPFLPLAPHLFPSALGWEIAEHRVPW